MELKELQSILEDRYVELYRLMNVDESKSLDWYDGARSELKHTLYLLKRHLPQPPKQDKPYAIFHSNQIVFSGKYATTFYEIIGGPSDGSTVTSKRLKELGIEIKEEEDERIQL